jgi:protein-L-isoaspartate(D-aspartate) O-methyltransferase
MDLMLQDEIHLKKARREMVERQIIARGINDSRVIDAFLEVPRHNFISIEFRQDAYDDHPLPIGFCQTISQPYIVALMTCQLALEGTEKVLEIGTGSGYQAAILSLLAREVHSVERIQTLADAAGKRLSDLHYDNVQIHVGDGSRGWPLAAPYDAIVVTAAAPKVPACLIDQLKVGGRLVIPVGARGRQILEVWEKQTEEMIKSEILPVVFVPLKGDFGWQDLDW